MNEHDFGMKLRALRHDRAETLEDVAAATGLSVAMLSRVERGQRLPSPESVEALAEHFGLPAEELMSATIASRMMNRYGRESSARAAERMQSPEMSWDCGEASSAGVAESATRAREGSVREFAEMRTDEVAESRPAPERTVASMAQPRPSAPARLPMQRAGMAFSAQPIETLFGEDAALDSLADAARVAEVALESAIRAVRRAQASGDPDQVEEAERVLARLRRAVG